MNDGLAGVMAELRNVAQEKYTGRVASSRGFVPRIGIFFGGRCNTGASAGSIGTSLASQNSHLNSVFFSYLPTRLLLFFPSFFLFFCRPCQYVRACCPASTANTAHSKAEPALHKAANKVRAHQSATTQASRQSRQELACRRAFIRLAAFSERTKNSKSARPTTLRSCLDSL